MSHDVIAGPVVCAIVAQLPQVVGLTLLPVSRYFRTSPSAMLFTMGSHPPGPHGL
jgi:hypothetical protein